MTVVCRWSSSDACGRAMTQEDGLCDACRTFHPQEGWTLELAEMFEGKASL